MGKEKTLRIQHIVCQYYGSWNVWKFSVVHIFFLFLSPLFILFNSFLLIIPVLFFSRCSLFYPSLTFSHPAAYPYPIPLLSLAPSFSPPCSFPWVPTCLFIRSCSPVLSPDWRYKWILWSLPYWWTISWEAAKHQHSRNGFAGIFRMPKQSHLGKHWHYGSKKKRLFLPHPRQWPPSVKKLSRKVWKVFPNFSLWLQLGQSVQPDLALPDNGPMNQTLAKNTKIFGIPFIIYEYISCKKGV